MQRTILLAAVGALLAADAPGGRVAKTINREWSFQYFPSPDADARTAAAPPEERVPGNEEPLLAEAGRVAVARDRSFQAIAAGTRGRIEPIDRDFDLPPSTREQYGARLDPFVREKNPRLDTGTEAYAAFLDRLVQTLVERRGHLVRDDYNFMAAQYDDRKKKTKK